ncbi:MAG: DUF5615 family PIN-like protein [bacterium]|nr:DUF5615 family PIN-like protein [bacterium]
MPPRLLLDVHFSRAVADALRTRGFDVVAAQDDAWLRSRSDEHLLAAAAEQRRAVVTYNIDDFVTLARAWAMGERGHFGIVLVHPGTIAQADIGGQVRALERLLAPLPTEDALRTVTVFLGKADL